MRSSIIIFLLFLPSCQWLTPPEEELVILLAEKAVEQVYEYETRTLSPGPPLGYPPMRIPGASGP